MIISSILGGLYILTSHKCVSWLALLLLFIESILLDCLCNMVLFCVKIVHLCVKVHNLLVIEWLTHMLIICHEVCLHDQVLHGLA